MADINKIRRQQVIMGEQSVIAGLIAKGLVQPIDAEMIKKDCEECERVQEEKSKLVELRLAVVMPALPFYCETCGSKFSQKPETEYCPICKYHSIKDNAV